MYQTLPSLYLMHQESLPVLLSFNYWQLTVLQGLLDCAGRLLRLNLTVRPLTTQKHVLRTSAEVSHEFKALMRTESSTMPSVIVGLLVLPVQAQRVTMRWMR